MATNFEDLVAKVKNLVVLAPVLGAILRPVCSSFSRYYVCKQHSAFQAASFGDLLNEKQKKPFVSLKDEVTITQSFFTVASLAQVENGPNEADANLFCRDTRGLDLRSVKSFFSLFCFSSSFKTLLRVFVIELPFLPVEIWPRLFESRLK